MVLGDEKPEKNAAFNALKGSVFAVTPSDPDNFENFYKRFVYLLLGAGEMKEIFVKNDYDHFGGLAQDLCRFFADVAHNYDLLRITPFNAHEFKTALDAAIQNFSTQQGTFEAIYNAYTYLVERSRSVNPLNYDDYRQLRAVFGLPAQCFLFQKAFGDACLAHEALFKREHPEEKKHDVPPPPVSGFFLSRLKDKDSRQIALGDERFISFSNYSDLIPATDVSALILEHLGPNAVKMGSMGEPKVHIGEDKRVFDNNPLQCYVHASHFDLPAPAAADPLQPVPHVGFVAVDRFEGGRHETELWAVPSQLKDLEWNIYIKMAETHLINYIFSRPPEERNHTIFMWNIHPETPPQLLAAMQFCMRQAGREDIQFVCAPELQNTIENLVATVPPDLAKAAGADPLLVIDPRPGPGHFI